MKTRHPSFVGFVPLIVLAAALPLAAQPTYTWDNGDSANLWGTSANWVGSPTLTFNNLTNIVSDDASVVNRANASTINKTGLGEVRPVRDQDWLFDGRGRFYDTRGAANRNEYRDVSTSDDAEVVAARRRFGTYLQDFPRPDEKDPSTRKTWQRFRASAKGAPVEVFRPANLE